MAWKSVDIHEQRVRFVVAATQRSQPFSSLCAEFGISRPTGYLWLRRYEQAGIRGIAERSRKPHASPSRTSAWLEDRVSQVRLHYPDWGARKLRVVLSREGVELPRSTIHRILLRHNLVRQEDQHAPALERFERKQPHELWQMDFKGPKGWPQPVGPLMDHGSPWWGHLAPSGHTYLSLWLMRQGIRLHWSGIRHPQTQGKVERFHGSLQRALTRRGFPRENMQTWLDDYRWEHNYVRPHEALNMKTPASVWNPSPRRYDPQPPRWEYPPGAWVLKVDREGKVHWTPAAKSADKQ